MEKGLKELDGKLRWSLLPTKALQGCIRVLTFGCKKYSPNNWKVVKPQGSYLDATFRHLIKYSEGEEFDDESEESHLSHAICDILFLEYHRMNRNTSQTFEDYLENILDYKDYIKED